MAIVKGKPNLNIEYLVNRGDNSLFYPESNVGGNMAPAVVNNIVKKLGERYPKDRLVESMICSARKLAKDNLLARISGSKKGDFPLVIEHHYSYTSLEDIIREVFTEEGFDGYLVFIKPSLVNVPNSIAVIGNTNFLTSEQKELLSKTVGVASIETGKIYPVKNYEAAAKLVSTIGKNRASGVVSTYIGVQTNPLVRELVRTIQLTPGILVYMMGKPVDVYIGSKLDKDFPISGYKTGEIILIPREKLTSSYLSTPEGEALLNNYVIKRLFSTGGKGVLNLQQKHKEALKKQGIPKEIEDPIFLAQKRIEPYKFMIRILPTFDQEDHFIFVKMVTSNSKNLSSAFGKEAVLGYHIEGEYVWFFVTFNRDTRGISEVHKVDNPSSVILDKYKGRAFTLRDLEQTIQNYESTIRKLERQYLAATKEPEQTWEETIGYLGKMVIPEGDPLSSGLELINGFSRSYPFAEKLYNYIKSKL